MDSFHKLQLLGGGACFDLCEAATSRRKVRRPDRIGAPGGSGITRTTGPGGRPVALLRVLQSNACERDCSFCPHRASRNTERATFQAEELADLFLEFYKRNYVEGLFLSSAVYQSTNRTTEEMVKTLEMPRRRHKYAGYVHCKVTPGADRAAVEQLARYSDRLSLNVEVPADSYLRRLTTGKDFARDILEPMRWVRELIARGDPKPGKGRGRGAGMLTAGQTTQFVVGAAGESDREIVDMAARLYQEFELRRVHFSPFTPIEGTPLEQQAPTPLARAQRLYQLDWLGRAYGFSQSELEGCFDAAGRLELSQDPKLTLALRRPESFPVEVNQADYEQLLRVPGIGPTAARRIVHLRGQAAFSGLAELRALGAVVERARPFILIGGKPQGTLADLRRPQQLSFW